MDHSSFPELPKVAKGVVFKRTPPKNAPLTLVRLLNDVARVLQVAYQGDPDLPGVARIEGVTTSVTADWLGERNWQLEFSATNSLPREVGSQEFPKGLPGGGMIESLEQFAHAIPEVNRLLNAALPKTQHEGQWNLMGGLAAHFEKHAWSIRPGAAGEDGQPRGIVVVLNLATKPGVGSNPPYWEV